MTLVEEQDIAALIQKIAAMTTSCSYIQKQLIITQFSTTRLE